MSDMKYFIRQLDLTDKEVSLEEYQNALFDEQIIFGETIELVLENKLVLIQHKNIT